MEKKEWGIGLTAACMVLFSNPALAGPSSVDRFLDGLQTEHKLSDLERDAIRPEIVRYVEADGDLTHASRLITTGLEDCWGQCLPVLVRGVANAVVLGMNDRGAVDTALRVLDRQLDVRDRAGERWSAQDLGQRLERRLEVSLESWRTQQLRRLSG